MNKNSNTDVHLVSAVTGEGISSLIYSIEACQHTDVNNILRTKERLLSAWDSRLLSHPSLNDILIELDDGMMTFEQAVDLICKLGH